MDDTPGQFVQELRYSLLKKRAGQIALAVILAEACLRFLNALTWFLVVPIIAMVLKGHTESVLFETQTRASVSVATIIRSDPRFQHSSDFCLLP